MKIKSIHQKKERKNDILSGLSNTIDSIELCDRQDTLKYELKINDGIRQAQQKGYIIITVQLKIELCLI